MISAGKQVSLKDWAEALEVLDSLGVNVEFMIQDITEEQKPAIVSLARALSALKKRRPEAWKKMRP